MVLRQFLGDFGGYEVTTEVGAGVALVTHHNGRVAFIGSCNAVCGSSRCWLLKCHASILLLPRDIVAASTLAAVIAQSKAVLPSMLTG